MLSPSGAASYSTKYHLKLPPCAFNGGVDDRRQWGSMAVLPSVANNGGFQCPSPAIGSVARFRGVVGAGNASDWCVAGACAHALADYFIGTAAAAGTAGSGEAGVDSECRQSPVHQGNRSHRRGQWPVHFRRPRRQGRRNSRRQRWPLHRRSLCPRPCRLRHRHNSSRGYRRQRRGRCRGSREARVNGMDSVRCWPRGTISP